METIGLGFSRKPHLCAGMTVHKTNPVRNTLGTNQINILRRRGAGIWYGRRRIFKSRDIRKEM
jgi:hypothetical protein